MSSQSQSSDSGLSSLATSPKLSTLMDVGGGRRLRRRSKRRLCSSTSTASFHDVYTLSGEVLGEGAYGRVETCVNLFTEREYAVKLISKHSFNFSRSKVLKEIELCHLCQNQPHLMSMIEYFEEAEHFYLVFEKADAGHLLKHIRANVVGRPKVFEEQQARHLLQQLCSALVFLHSKGVAHRDIKPENILCFNVDSKDDGQDEDKEKEKSKEFIVKLGDFDLCSSVQTEVTTPLLQSPVGSAEYMAPEVVRIFEDDDLMDDCDNDYSLNELTMGYDKQCDMWSLGVLAYVLLTGCLPFSAVHCGREECKWDEGDECAQCQHSLFNAICNNEPVFPQQLFANVSEEAQDLVKRLLQKNPHLRPTADEAFNHPWLVEKPYLEDKEISKDHEGLKEDEGLFEDYYRMQSSYVTRDSRLASIDENTNAVVDAEVVCRVLHQLQLDEDERRQRRVDSWQHLQQGEDELMCGKEQLRKSATASADLTTFVSCGFDSAEGNALALAMESAELSRQQLCSP